MTRDPVSGIRVLDSTVAYADGAEDRLLEIFAGTTDVSSLSDELAARIDDWPTRYHLARERSNLLRPLGLGPSLRILEIGAGTGAVSRFMGETGARVVALEGSLARARAAAERCRDLENVEVVCGALDAFDDPDGFDLVCLIGVLEYACVGPAGTDPESFLGQATRHLRPGGSLVVAIENQLGLKYLLGYDEDHLGRPWVGLEGYSEAGGVRTFARRRLAALLEGCGLERQRWFYPYPDYKMPATIIPDNAYEEPDAVNFIDQVVGSPVARHDSQSGPLCDARRVHRVMLDAGLGREVANSFLVLASAGAPGHDADPDPGTLAWLYGSPRRRLWIRHQVVEGGATGRRIRTGGPNTVATRPSDGWLRQDPAKDEDFVVGSTVWELASEASRRRDAYALMRTLEPWRRVIDEQRTTVGAPKITHPFLLPSTTEVLPPDHLDLCTSNFVVTDEKIHFIDREWMADPAVDADLVTVRGLWLLAQQLVSDGGIHPWSPSLSVDELTMRLGDLMGLPAKALLEPLYTAERELLHLVTGRDRDEIERDLAWLGASRPTDPETISALPLSRLRDRLDAVQGDLDRGRDELGSARGELARERSERARLEGEVAHERRTVAELSDELGATHEKLAATGVDLEANATALGEARDEIANLREALSKADGLRERLAEVETEAEILRTWRKAFENRLPVRILRRFQR